MKRRKKLFIEAGLMYNPENEVSSPEEGVCISLQIRTCNARKGFVAITVSSGALQAPHRHLRHLLIKYNYLELM